MSRAALTGLERSTIDLFGAPRHMVTVAASTTVIAHWLTPRLPGLEQAVPGALVSLITIHTASEFAAVHADFEVRFGGGVWPGRRARKLFDEVLAPVAAPVLLGDDAENWRRLPQIAVSGPRAGWQDWAATAGVAPPRPPTQRFDSFALALGAALSGHGVLLGSLALLDAPLADGRLVRVPAPEMRMADGYWLTWAREAEQRPGHGAAIAALCG